MDPLFFENLVIRMLFVDEMGRDRIYPFLSLGVFESFENQRIVQAFLDFKNKYNEYPSAKGIELFLQDKSIYDHLKMCLSIDTKEYNDDYVSDSIETFFKNKLLMNNIEDAITNLKESDHDSMSNIIDDMRNSLSFSFDTTVGLDYHEDVDKMYEALHNKDNVIPTGIKNLDKMIAGGFHEKSLTLFMAECVTGDTKVRIRFRER